MHYHTFVASSPSVDFKLLFWIFFWVCAIYGFTQMAGGCMAHWSHQPGVAPPVNYGVCHTVSTQSVGRCANTPTRGAP